MESAAVEGDGDGDATGGLEAVDRSSIIPVSCPVSCARPVGSKSVPLSRLSRLSQTLGKEGAGGRCAGAAEGEFVRIGRFRPLIGWRWPGAGGVAVGALWGGWCAHCGAPATTRSTICINSTKKGSVTTARHAPARAGHTTAEGVESTLGPVCGLGLALQSCNPALKVLADPAVLVLVVVARWILYRGLDSPCQRGDVPGCWPPESKNAMERGVEDGGEVEGGSETQRDADAEMQRCRDAECRVQSAEGRNKSAGAAEAFLRNGMSRGRSWAGKQRLRSACAARCCTRMDGNLRWETGRRPRE